MKKALLELSAALSTGARFRELSALVVAHALRITDSEACYVACRNPETDSLEVVAIAGEWANLAPSPSLQPPDLPDPLIRNNAAGCPLKPRLFGPQSSPRNFLSIPLFVDDSLQGRLVVANSSRDYTDRDVFLLAQLSGI